MLKGNIVCAQGVLCAHRACHRDSRGVCAQGVSCAQGVCVLQQRCDVLKGCVTLPRGVDCASRGVVCSRGVLVL